MFLEILGFCVGVVYLWWEYHADARVWLASVVMPAISMWIYFSRGIYADFAINIYYLLIAVYGFWAWTRKNKTAEGPGKELRITRLKPLLGTGLLGVAAALWAILAWLLVTFTDSTVPYWDALTTSLSIVALWMMARKIAEQWLVWLVVDAFSVGLYAYKGLVFYPILYAVYTVIAWAGYRKWLRLMRKDA